MALGNAIYSPASTSSSQQQSQSQQQAQQQSSSSSYIPNYSQTPILENIAQYAEQMAPQVYQWGMQQYNNNQANINALMRQGQEYASPQRIASEMGMAEAGTQQAGEAQRQAALNDLQSYGIDPSSGRYAALDQANRVQMAASAAGAGNQQRMATQAAGLGQQYEAGSMGLQNLQTGYGAANAMNQLLGTGMNLKYAPLGQTAESTGSSSGESTSSGTSGTQTPYSPYSPGTQYGPSVMAKGGYVPSQWSPSGGGTTDDVPARLNVGEFVIPKDVVKIKGTEFFRKLIEQSRKARMDSEANNRSTATGYQHGGYVYGATMEG